MIEQIRNGLIHGFALGVMGVTGTLLLQKIIAFFFKKTAADQYYYAKVLLRSAEPSDLRQRAFDIFFNLAVLIFMINSLRQGTDVINFVFVFVCRPYFFAAWNLAIDQPLANKKEIFKSELKKIKVDFLMFALKAVTLILSLALAILGEPTASGLATQLAFWVMFGIEVLAIWGVLVWRQRPVELS